MHSRGSDSPNSSTHVTPQRMHRKPGRNAPLVTGPRIAVAILGGLLMYIGYSLSTGAGAASCAKLGRRYGLMLDAGSTGSRIHVYDLDYKPSGAVVLSHEVFEELKPGLSSFKDDPKAAADSLRPLMSAAVRTVPESEMACTPIELKATAGLRLVGHEKSAAILQAVLDLFREYKFLVAGPSAAIVMDGKDEGPFAWATVNFLLSTITPDASQGTRTAAVIDMGGASTQIVFQPDRGIDSRAADHEYRLNLFGRTSRVYQHSHLGYGLKEAGKAMMRRAGPSNSFPCFPKTYSAKISGGEHDGEDISNTAGTQSFDECRKVAEDIMHKDAACTKAPCSFNGVWQPSLTKEFSGPIYAFSYYYDRLEAWLPENGIVTLSRFAEVGSRLCASADESDAEFGAHNKGTMCMDFAYLYALLRVGYDLPDATELHVKKKINGIETAWALGAMLAVMK